MHTYELARGSIIIIYIKWNCSSQVLMLTVVFSLLFSFILVDTFQAYNITTTHTCHMITHVLLGLKGEYKIYCHRAQHSLLLSLQFKRKSNLSWRFLLALFMCIYYAFNGSVVRWMEWWKILYALLTDMFFSRLRHVYIFRAISTVNIMQEKEAKILGKQRVVLNISCTLSCFSRLKW